MSPKLNLMVQDFFFYIQLLPIITTVKENNAIIFLFGLSWRENNGCFKKRNTQSFIVYFRSGTSYLGFARRLWRRRLIGWQVVCFKEQLDINISNSKWKSSKQNQNFLEFVSLRNVLFQELVKQYIQSIKATLVQRLIAGISSNLTCVAQGIGKGLYKKIKLSVGI